MQLTFKKKTAIRKFIVEILLQRVPYEKQLSIIAI